MSSGGYRIVLLSPLLAAALTQAHAMIPAAAKNGKSISTTLNDLQEKILNVEASLLDSVKLQSEAKANLRTLQSLIKLRREERELGRKRLVELEDTVSELEVRRGMLKERIHLAQGGIRARLIQLQRARMQPLEDPIWSKGERVAAEAREAARRKALSGIARKGVRELDLLKIDLADAERLENRIQDERQQLVALTQELEEKEGVLELNRQLQADLLARKHEDRLRQLRSYRQLKKAEGEVERLLGEFNARRELERAAEAEKSVHRAFAQAAFSKLQGRLPLPVSGKVVSRFGKNFDPASGLHVFKKGIEIAASQGSPVKAVTAGRVAYVGEMPKMGQIVILDHGDHFYTISGNLGATSLRKGDAVAPGDRLGISARDGTPVYFEIRARNIAVNPLQWVSG
jgi:septal ring factor EnvC (AmiA/AmiB activator)